MPKLKPGWYVDFICLMFEYLLGGDLPVDFNMSVFAPYLGLNSSNWADGKFTGECIYDLVSPIMNF